MSKAVRNLGVVRRGGGIAIAYNFALSTRELLGKPFVLPITDLRVQHCILLLLLKLPGLKN